MEFLSSEWVDAWVARSNADPAFVAAGKGFHGVAVAVIDPDRVRAGARQILRLEGSDGHLDPGTAGNGRRSRPRCDVHPDRALSHLEIGDPGRVGSDPGPGVWSATGPRSAVHRLAVEQAVSPDGRARRCSTHDFRRRGPPQ